MVTFMSLGKVGCSNITSFSTVKDDFKNKIIQVNIFSVQCLNAI